MLGHRRPELQLLPQTGDQSQTASGAPFHVLARGVLRLILADRLALKTGRRIAHPLDLRVRVDGKPHLAGEEIAFSMAHSGPFALIAVADLEPLGVDLELPRAVAIEAHRRWQIEAVAAALAPEPMPYDAEPRLLVGWTRIEAVAKATGEGVGRLMTRLGMTRTSAISSDPAPGREAARWIAGSGLVVRDLALGHGRFAALAYNAMLPPPRLLVEADAIAGLISTTSSR